MKDQNIEAKDEENAIQFRIFGVYLCVFGVHLLTFHFLHCVVFIASSSFSFSLFFFIFRNS